MKASRALTLGFVLVMVAPLAQAQEAMPGPPPVPEDAVMDARVGTWQGTGTMMGMPVSETTTSEWALGHRFVVSQSTMTMTMPDGSEMPMEMLMITKVHGDGTYAGTYMDSWGSMGPFTSLLDEAGNMVTEWTDPMEGGAHRVVETVNPDGSVSSQFYMQQADGSWAESGAMSYTRAAE